MAIDVIVISNAVESSGGYSIADIFPDNKERSKSWHVKQWHVNPSYMQDITFLDPMLVKESLLRLKSKTNLTRPVLLLMERTTLKNVTNESRRKAEEEKFLHSMKQLGDEAGNDVTFIGCFGKLPHVAKETQKYYEGISFQKTFAMMIKGKAAKKMIEADQKHLSSWGKFREYMSDNHMVIKVVPNMLDYDSGTVINDYKVYNYGLSGRSRRSRAVRRAKNKKRGEDRDYEYHWHECDEGDSPNKWTWGKLGWYLLLFLILALFIGLMWLAFYFRVEYCLDRSIDSGW